MSQALQEVLERVRRGEAEPEYANAYAMSPDELRSLVELDVRRAYLERIRRRRPTRETIIVEVDSVSRHVQNERTTVRWIDRDRAYVQSEGGGQYVTTTEACTCPDFIHRRSRDPELAAEGCRHMQALRLARQQLAERRRLARQQRRQSVVENTSAIHEENRLTFARVDWTEDEQRERILDIWRQNRAFDGVFMSRDDAAWEALKRQAEQEWEYQYENVLGGTGNSFGIEIEVEFENSYYRSMAMRDLYEAGLSRTLTLMPYHSRGEPGFWKVERDGSLGENGAEFVSPVLYDTPETWQQIEKLTEILKRHGAKVTPRCGGHIHIGIAPLDHRTYSWQRLARIGVGYEKQFYRMGGADSESYRNHGTPGQHRGTRYAAPLNRGLTFSGEVTPEEARRRIGNNTRYTIFNTTNIDPNGRPAIEFRYPNGSLDHRQIQAQIQVANAIVHQAGVIRNDSPLSEFTPRFSEYDKQLRYGQSVSPEVEEMNFRRFLDVLGNPKDRLAATWLWIRGRA